MKGRTDRERRRTSETVREKGEGETRRVKTAQAGQTQREPRQRRRGGREEAWAGGGSSMDRVGARCAAAWPEEAWAGRLWPAWPLHTPEAAGTLRAVARAGGYDRSYTKHTASGRWSSGTQACWGREMLSQVRNRLGGWRAGRRQTRAEKEGWRVLLAWQPWASGTARSPHFHDEGIS